jgi:hypothetical protein
MISINAVDNMRRCSAVVAAQRSATNHHACTGVNRTVGATVSRIDGEGSSDPDGISALASSWDQGCLRRIAFLAMRYRTDAVGYCIASS